MAQIGDKFIIEIGDEYFQKESDVVTNEQAKAPFSLYRIKGFNTLNFDEQGLNKLKKYDPDAEYERGLKEGAKSKEGIGLLCTERYELGVDDAFNTMLKIATSTDKGGLTQEDLISLFGTANFIEIMLKHKPNDVVIKIWLHEQERKRQEVKQQEIKTEIHRTHKGKWIFENDYNGKIACKCSECGTHIVEYEVDKYCRECGTEMEGVVNE